MDRFQRRIARRDAAGRFAKAYTVYVAGFLFLEVLHLFFGGALFILTNRRTLFAAEVLIFAVLFVLLWSVYGALALYCRLFNREMLYHSLLKQEYTESTTRRYANYGVTFESIGTLALFPEISQDGGIRNRIFGWGVNGRMIAEPTGDFNAGDKVCLRKKPAVFSEQITMRLSLGFGKAERTLPSYPKDEQERLLKLCYREARLLFDAPLVQVPLFLTADEQLVLVPELLSLPVEKEAAAVGERFAEALVTAAAGELSKRLERPVTAGDRAGILSLFLDHATGEAGFCSVIRLSGRAEALNGTDVTFLDLSDHAEEHLAKLISDRSLSPVLRYALLILTYAQYDQFLFSAKLCARDRKRTVRALSRELFSKRTPQGAIDPVLRELEAALPNQAELRSHPLYIRHPRLTRIGNLVQSLPDRLHRLVLQYSKGLLVTLLFFLLENIIEPIIVDPELTQAAGFKSLLRLLRRSSMQGLRSTALVIGILIVAVLLLNFFGRLVERRRREAASGEKAFSLFGNRGILSAKEPEGFPDSAVRLTATGTVRAFPQELRDPAIYRSFDDDGVKYMLCDKKLREGSIECMLDECRFSDTQAVQALVKRERSGTLDSLPPQFREQLVQYQNAIGGLRSGQLMTEEDRCALPPNSLCAHTCIVTKDGWLVVMKRSPHTSYYPGCYSVSTEEQLSILDIYADGVRLNTWIERMCEEELGLTRKNSNCGTLGEARLMSIFEEKDILNVAFCVFLRLNVKKRQLNAILSDWPRKDYEGAFTFVRWETLWNHWLKAALSGAERYHPTSIYRFYFAALAAGRLDLVRRIQAAEKEFTLDK